MNSITTTWGCHAGADVGGFFGNAEAELIVRWNQLATYYPFFRGHGHLETKRREPWLFGPDNSRRNRQALRERYALLPYLYTLFWEAHTLGLPIMRPMYYEFPEVNPILPVFRVHAVTTSDAAALLMRV